MKVKITKLFISDKDRDGRPLTTKDGRSYSKIAIKCEQYGDRWLSGFLGDWNSDWKVNDEVNLKIEEVASKTGNVYLNFRRMDKIDELEERIKVLEDFIKK